MIALVLIGLAVLTLSCKGINSYSLLNSLTGSNSVPFISDTELDSLYRNSASFYLYDTRTKEEFDVSHLQGAVWIGDKDTLPTNVKEPLPIVVYCSVGYRSGKAGKRMLKAGFKDVYNLEGGIFKWINSGKEIINTEGEPTDSIHGYSPRWGAIIKRGTVVYER